MKLISRSRETVSRGSGFEEMKPGDPSRCLHQNAVAKLWLGRAANQDLWRPRISIQASSWGKGPLPPDDSLHQGLLLSSQFSIPFEPTEILENDSVKIEAARTQ